jgi:fructose-specific phosphotransferase system IIC component
MLTRLARQCVVAGLIVFLLSLAVYSGDGILTALVRGIAGGVVIFVIVAATVKLSEHRARKRRAS